MRGFFLFTQFVNFLTIHILQGSLGSSKQMKHQQKSNRLDYILNLGLAALAGLSGCLSMVVIFGGLLIGLTLDYLLGTRPLFTILVLVLSVPLALWLMVQLALRSTKTLERRQWGNRAEQNEQD